MTPSDLLERLTDVRFLIAAMVIPQFLPLCMWWLHSKHKEREARKDAQVRAF